MHLAINYITCVSAYELLHCASYFCPSFLVHGLSHVCVVQSDNIHIGEMCTTESCGHGQTSQEGGA